MKGLDIVVIDFLHVEPSNSYTTSTLHPIRHAPTIFVYSDQVPNSEAVVSEFARALDEILCTVDVWRRLYKFDRGYDSAESERAR